MEEKNKKYRVAYVTGTRAEFGYVKSVLQEINASKEMEVLVIATGMHTAQGFGNTVRDVEASGLPTVKIEDGNDGKSLSSMTASVGANVIHLSAIFEKEKPDLLIAEGDRSEQLSATITAAYFNIPVIHRAGGNTSGSIDNKIRWALSALADYHFPSNKVLGKNLEKHGVPKEKIYNIGGVVPDAIARKEFLPSEECRKKYNLVEGPRMLLVYHPNTEEHDKVEDQIEEILQALSTLRFQTIAIGSNSDAGGAIINKRLAEYAKENAFLQFHIGLSRFDYLGLLNCIDVLVGNTSSGFSELPSFKKPYVLIGTRQTNRFGEARHIIQVPPNSSKIITAIRRALTDKKFRSGLKKLKNPYGNGDFYKKFPPLVLDILRKGKQHS